VLEVAQRDVDATVTLVCDQMSDAYALDVPLVVDVRTGQNWDEMKRVAVPALA